jgi:hypothetical protein
MYKLSSREIELKKLYSFLEKVNQSLLGCDRQTRSELMHIQEKTIEKIKFIQSQQKH